MKKSAIWFLSDYSLVIICICILYDCDFHLYTFEHVYSYFMFIVTDKRKSLSFFA